jgi:prepilin-type N-terminal cleavage/methylation domain-containing protein
MIKPRTNGFTLIEMLVVIVVVAIMAAIAIPAVTNLMKSGGVNSATREVANTLGLARQLAVTQRIYARVVFPYSLTGSRPDMWYLTYAVMTNRNNTVASGWTYASKWEFLPVGAIFLNNNPSGVTPLPSGGGSLDDLNSLSVQSSLPFPDTNPSHIGQLAYIEFGPTGVASTLSAVAITEGFMNGPVPQPTASKTSSNTLANLTALKVDNLVGRIQVVRP